MKSVEGCALVRFSTDANGTPVSIKLVAEYPAGFQFGQASVSWVAHARWRKAFFRKYFSATFHIHPN
jgi:hypothetical protein